jgi:hypothetical protein
VRQEGGVQRVQFGFIEVGLENACLQVVQDDVARTAAQRMKRFLMKTRPSGLVGLPDRRSVTLARVLERHDKQPWTAVAAIRLQGGCPLAEVDLGFLSGEELEHIEAVGFPNTQLRHKPLDRVVAMRKPMHLDQILVEAHRIAPQTQLRLDPAPVNLTRRLDVGSARRNTGLRGPFRHRELLKTRWPGWGSLARIPVKAGGRGGGICLPYIAANRLAVHTDPTGNLPLTHTRRQQAPLSIVARK